MWKPNIPIIIVIQFSEFRFLSLCALYFILPYFALGALDAHHTMRRGDAIRMNPWNRKPSNYFVIAYWEWREWTEADAPCSKGLSAYYPGFNWFRWSVWGKWKDEMYRISVCVQFQFIIHSFIIRNLERITTDHRWNQAETKWVNAIIIVLYAWRITM